MKLTIIILLQIVVLVGLATGMFALPSFGLPHITFAEELRAVKKGDTLVIFNDGRTEDVGIYHYGYALSINEHLAICTADVTLQPLYTPTIQTSNSETLKGNP